MLSRPPRISALLLSSIALFAVACTSTTTTTNTNPDDTAGLTPALIVRPREFMGDTPCSAAPGAMRSYVATLTDHLSTTDAGGNTVEERFTFPSSLPTSCGQGVRFDDAVGGHIYSVDIEGYEDFAGDIGPVGWLRADGTVNYTKLRSGDRHMVDRDGKPVTPRWLTTCGDDDPTLAAASGTTLIRDCKPLVDTGEPGPTAVEIDPLDTLGTAACAGYGAPGQVQVATFDVQSLGGLGNTKGIACTAGLPALTYTSSALEPGDTAEFWVAAHETDGGPVTLGATCSAQVKEGLTVRAACPPLSTEGSVALDFGKVLEANGYACGGDFATYDAVVTIGEKTISQGALPCEIPGYFSPLPGGAHYELDAEVVAKDGKQLFAAHCEGDVAPGRTTLVTGCIQQ